MFLHSDHNLTIIPSFIHTLQKYTPIRTLWKGMGEECGKTRTEHAAKVKYIPNSEKACNTEQQLGFWFFQQCQWRFQMQVTSVACALNKPLTSKGAAFVFTTPSSFLNVKNLPFPLALTIFCQNENQRGKNKKHQRHWKWPLLKLTKMLWHQQKHLPMERSKGHGQSQ